MLSSHIEKVTVAMVKYYTAPFAAKVKWFGISLVLISLVLAPAYVSPGLSWLWLTTPCRGPCFGSQALRVNPTQIQSGAPNAVEWHTAPASWFVPSRLDLVWPLDQMHQDERVTLIPPKSPSGSLLSDRVALFMITLLASIAWGRG